MSTHRLLFYTLFISLFNLTHAYSHDQIIIEPISISETSLNDYSGCTNSIANKLIASFEGHGDVSQNKLIVQRIEQVNCIFSCNSQQTKTYKAILGPQNTTQENLTLKFSLFHYEPLSGSTNAYNFRSARHQCRLVALSNEVNSTLSQTNHYRKCRKRAHYVVQDVYAKIKNYPTQNQITIMASKPYCN